MCICVNLSPLNLFVFPFEHSSPPVHLLHRLLPSLMLLSALYSSCRLCFLGSPQIHFDVLSRWMVISSFFTPPSCVLLKCTLRLCLSFLFYVCSEWLVPVIVYLLGSTFVYSHFWRVPAFVFSVSVCILKFPVHSYMQSGFCYDFLSLSCQFFSLILFLLSIYFFFFSMQQGSAIFFSERSCSFLTISFPWREFFFSLNTRQLGFFLLYFPTLSHVSASLSRKHGSSLLSTTVTLRRLLLAPPPPRLGS